MGGIVALLMRKGPEPALMGICHSDLLIEASQWSHSTGGLLFIVITCIVLYQLHMPYLWSSFLFAALTHEVCVRNALSFCGHDETVISFGHHIVAVRRLI